MAHLAAVVAFDLTKISFLAVSLVFRCRFLLASAVCGLVSLLTAVAAETFELICEETQLRSLDWFLVLVRVLLP